MLLIKVSWDWYRRNVDSVQKYGGKKLMNTQKKKIISRKGCTWVSSTSAPYPMKGREIRTGPGIDVAMGLLPSGDYIFVIIDFFRRYKEIKTMNKITAVNTINDEMNKYFL